MTQKSWNIIFSLIFSLVIGGIIFLILVSLDHWHIAFVEAVVWAWGSFKALELVT